jgi:hypothetical protein
MSIAFAPHYIGRRLHIGMLIAPTIIARYLILYEPLPYSLQGQHTVSLSASQLILDGNLKVWWYGPSSFAINIHLLVARPDILIVAKKYLIAS